MLPDEKHPIAETKAPKEVEIEPAQDDPLTKAQFSAQIERLAERARRTGFNPIQAMFQSYARQGMSILDGLLVALENTDSPKKKKKKE